MESETDCARNVLKKRLSDVLLNTETILRKVDGIIKSTSIKVWDDLDGMYYMTYPSYITTVKRVSDVDKDDFAIQCLKDLDSVSVQTKEGKASVLTQIYSILRGNVYIVDFKNDFVLAMNGLNMDEKGVYRAMKEYNDAKNSCPVVRSLAKILFGPADRHDDSYIR